MDQPFVMYPGAIESIIQAKWQPGPSNVLVIGAYFQKHELTNAIPDDGKVKLLVVGQFNNGQYFIGNRKVRIRR
jgi:hypothetical protein